MINTKDKKYIEEYCNIQIKNKDKIRIKSLAPLLSEHYALFEIKQYIKNELKIEDEYILHPKSTYLCVVHGHIRINTSDLYYKNVYLHQYMVHKAFNISMKTVSKYVIHHISLDKHNNDVSNLWLFYNQQLHREFHIELEKNKDISISIFTKNWIEDTLNAENCEELAEYLKLLLRIENDKKCLSLEGLDEVI